MSNENEIKFPTVEELNERYETKSARIRKLLACGMTRYRISQYLGIRYQHVRNVDITPVKTPKEKV